MGGRGGMEEREGRRGEGREGGREGRREGGREGREGRRGGECVQPFNTHVQYSTFQTIRTFLPSEVEESCLNFIPCALGGCSTPL